MDITFGEMIYSYTRQQAIEDGVLIDISTEAKQYGYRIPVAVTRTVWDKYIQWNDKLPNIKVVDCMISFSCYLLQSSLIMLQIQYYSNF